MIAGDALAETFGKGLTVIVMATVFEQPFLLVAVTVYVVVALGLTVILVVVAPVFHW